MRRFKEPTWALLLAVASVTASAQDWNVAADVAIQTRVFADDAQWAGQSGSTAHVALEGHAEFRWRNEDGSQRVSLIPYARWDAEDDERDLVDLQEAYWAWEGDSTNLLIGNNTVFWGVTESVHLVDVVNQTDFAGDIDGEDKLGQPMINAALQTDFGYFSAFVLPYFRERTFPGVDGRIRTPLPVDTDRPRYESRNEQSHVDFAFRYSHYIGNVDIGASVFSGTSREPRFVPSADGTTFIPVYDQIDQVGVDLQYTGDAWLWKLEAIARDGFTESFFAAVGGFEYTIFQVAGSDADLGLLMEYQYDDRSRLEPFTIAENDVFVGARLAMNDAQDATVLAGAVFDVDTDEMFFNVEAERRFGENYFLELRLRAFSGAERDDLSFAFAADDYVQLTLSRYF